MFEWAIGKFQYFTRVAGQFKACLSDNSLTTSLAVPLIDITFVSRSNLSAAAESRVRCGTEYARYVGHCRIVGYHVLHCGEVYAESSYRGV